MSSTELVVAVVPCKSESRRVPHKNARFVGGMPLWLRKAEQLRRIECIDEVWVDTDSPDIQHEATARGYGVLHRPPSINECDGHALFAWEVSQLPQASVYVQALCTAPFLSDDSIRHAVDVIVEAPTHDCASVVVERRDYDALKHYEQIPDSDTLEFNLADCMSLYAVRGEYAREHGLRTSKDKQYFVVASDAEAMDIDWLDDLYSAQAYALGLNELERRRLRALTPVLSSAILSDCLEELGAVDYVMELEHCPHEKRFGRACTLELALDGSRSIYDALEHYEWCMPGDILCVSTGGVCAAYFGELNSLMAHRAGASACIVDGATRDIADTALPVWSDYRMPSDCRDILKVKSIGRAVEMQSVRVEPRELIYADADGVVRIPRELEEEVLDAALERAKSEASIKLSIAAGIPADKLVEREGNF